MSYWKENIPWTFWDVEPRPSFEQRRRMRYELQDYMKDAIRFEEWDEKKVLEVGCGAGIDAVEFARNGAMVTATDLNEEAIMETEHSFLEANARGYVRQADPRRLPFDNETFDLVYCFGVLHHIKFPRPIVKEFHRVLKRGGTCISMLYNKDSLLYAYSIEHMKMSFERVPGVPDTKAYTKQEAKNLFRAFKSVSALSFYNVIDTAQKRKVKLNIPDDLQLGWHLILRCVK